MTAPALRAIEVPVGLLEPRSDNPRQQSSTPISTKLQELAQSIRRQGVIEPLIVQQLAHSRFRIVCGERRWRAAQMAGLELVPVIVRELDSRQAFTVAVVENLQRRSLEPLDTAAALARMVDELGMTRDEVSEAIGRSKSWISKMLMLLELPKPVQRQVAGGKLSVQVALGYEAAPPQDIFSADEELQACWRKLRQEVLDWNDRRLSNALREFARAFGRAEQLRRGGGKAQNGHVPEGMLK